eukprot:CAMPEP_0198658622 /NCGR_PEP_ID=MMETSP1467-20131203/26503_1 /TAXON_ID=1462469 /ORGANISM="unid. sp., Strain CCMP2135" /LENGTH=127 /DNA_ID=CAMNT_0044394903 /DNA_START=77 /DNA_END=457 /DNA_ORIENTATION=+
MAFAHAGIRLLLLVATAASATVYTTPAPTYATMAPTAVAAPTILSVALDAAQEVDGVGDGAATGSVDLEFKPAEGLVCWTIVDLTGLSSSLVAGHIHEGAAGMNGPVTVFLFDGEAGVGDSDCVDVD